MTLWGCRLGMMLERWRLRSAGFPKRCVLFFIQIFTEVLPSESIRFFRNIHLSFYLLEKPDLFHSNEMFYYDTFFRFPLPRESLRIFQFRYPLWEPQTWGRTQVMFRSRSWIPRLKTSPGRKALRRTSIRWLERPSLCPGASPMVGSWDFPHGTVDGSEIPFPTTCWMYKTRRK